MVGTQGNPEDASSTQKVGMRPIYRHLLLLGALVLVLVGGFVAAESGPPSDEEYLADLEARAARFGASMSMSIRTVENPSVTDDVAIRAAHEVERSARDLRALRPSPRYKKSDESLDRALNLIIEGQVLVQKSVRKKDWDSVFRAAGMIESGADLLALAEVERLTAERR